MGKDEIIKLARESQKESFVGDTGHWFKMEVKDLERFAALVAAKLFTYEQVRAHIQAAVMTEREACAKVCEDISEDRWNLYKGRPPYTGSESGRADPHEQGMSMGASECAEAIRARSNDGS